MNEAVGVNEGQTYPYWGSTSFSDCQAVDTQKLGYITDFSDTGIEMWNSRQNPTIEYAYPSAVNTSTDGFTVSSTIYGSGTP